MKTKNCFLIFVFFSLLISCKKEDNKEENFPIQLLPKLEWSDFNLYVGGIKQSTYMGKPSDYFKEPILAIKSITFKTDNECTVISPGNESFSCDYYFKNDSLFIIAEDKLFIGIGNYNKVTDSFQQYRIYSYLKHPDGHFNDTNGDQIIDSHDKMNVETSNFNEPLTAIKIAQAMGYQSLTNLDPNDTIIICKVTVTMMKDKNGDGMIDGKDE